MISFNIFIQAIKEVIILHYIIMNFQLRILFLEILFNAPISCGCALTLHSVRWLCSGHEHYPVLSASACRVCLPAKNVLSGIFSLLPQQAVVHEHAGELLAKIILCFLHLRVEFVDTHT